MTQFVGTVLHRIGPILGRVPSRFGLFPLVIDPVHRLLPESGRTASGTVAGYPIDLDLSEYVQRRIYYGMFEREICAFIRRHVRPGDTVVDVGANIGFITLNLARAVGVSGRVIAYEPMPGNAARLMGLIEANDLTQVELYQSAVSDTCGSMVIGSDLPTDDVRGVSGNFRVGGPYNAHEVATVTLDSHLVPLLSKGSQIRLLKLDIEGSEPRALAGAADLLRGPSRPQFVIVEVSPSALKLAEATIDDTVRPLRAAQYELRILGSGGRLKPVKSLLERMAETEISRLDGLGAHIRSYLRGVPTTVNMVAVAQG